MSVRMPYAAGRFFPAEANRLLLLMEELYQVEKDSIDIPKHPLHVIGGIVPHAAYRYSGYEAVHFFSILQQSRQSIDTVVVLHPDHYHHGIDLTVDSHDYWQTPLGNVQTDVDELDHLSIEKSMHALNSDHAAEVMLPFLQFFLNDTFKILVIGMTDQHYDVATFLAKQLAELQRRTGKQLLLIASSDFSHFVTPQEGRIKDDLIIEEIVNWRIQGVEKMVRKHRVSVCGYGPIMTLLEYAKAISEYPKVNVLARGPRMYSTGSRFWREKVVDYVSALVYEEIDGKV